MHANRGYGRRLTGTAGADSQREVQPAQRGGSFNMLDVLLVGVLPLAFLLLAPIQRFMEPGWVDPAMYLGLALDYFDMVRTYGWNYHALRVSFVVPNVLAHMIFAPETARLVVLVGFHLLSLIGLYTGVRLIWNRPAAAIAVAGLAYNPVYLKAITGGYIDAAVIGYLLMLFAALAIWSRSGRLVWIFLGGAAAALTVLAHSLAAAPTGLILLFFLALCWERILKRPLATIGCGLAGAVAVWVIFVVALAEIGFGLEAFQSLRWMITASVNGIGANYRYSLSDWLPAATRLLPGLLITASLLVVTLLPCEAGVQRRDWAALALSAATTAVLPIYDLVFGGSATQAAFYSGFVVPGIAIGTGALASALLPRRPERAWLCVAFVTCFAIVVMRFAPSLWWLADSSWLSLRLEVFCAVAVGLVAILVWALRQRLATAWILCALLGLQSLALAVNRDTRIVFRQPGGVQHVEFFRAAVFIRDQLRIAQPEGRLPLFWFDRPSFAMRDGRSSLFDRPLRFGDQLLVLNAYDSFAGLRFWHLGIFLPHLSPGQVLEPADVQRALGNSLVILTQDPNAIATARATLRRAGLQCRMKYETEYRGRSFDVTMAVIDVIGMAASEELSGC